MIDTVVNLAGGGSDAVCSTASYTLAAGVSVERLLARNPNALTNIVLTGNELVQDIIGEKGHNILDSGTGANDRLFGGEGDDTYLVLNAGDLVRDVIGQAFDTVRAAVSYAVSSLTASKRWRRSTPPRKRRST